MKLATSAWRLELPEGVIGRLVDPAQELGLREMAVARGWLGDHAVTVIVSLGDAGELTLRGRCREVSALLEPVVGAQLLAEGVACPVAGASGARRVDGLCRMAEGVSPDGLERWVIVVAGRGRREHVTLTIRTPLHADLAAEVEALIDGFSVDRGPAAA